MAQTSIQANAAMHGQQISTEGRMNQHGGADEHRLDRFMRNNPPTFKEMYDPEGTPVWLQGIERIFTAMATTDEQKVRLATHMLAEEVKYWWANARQRLSRLSFVFILYSIS